MAVRRGGLAFLALLATLALPIPTSLAGTAETSVPVADWVQTSDDSVVGLGQFRGLGEVANNFQAIVAGAGFNATDYRNIGSYTIRLATSTAGNIEIYRAKLQQAANEINAAGGASLTVAPGTVVGPTNANLLDAPDGEIWVMISASSPCGALSGGRLGCGGPSGSWVSGEPMWTSGTVWLSPTMSNACQQPVTSHEIGHALGLSHFDQQYSGVYQVMKSSTNCSFPIALQAGDLNGHRWLVEGATKPSNDKVANADEVCPLRDTTMSAINWFATAEAGEPAHAGMPASRSVWFRYTSRADQGGATATIRTTDDGTDDFDTVLAVYTGSMFAAATPIASNDNFAGDLSQVQFIVQAGQTYWIAVDGAGGAQGETDVVFDLPPTSPPTPPAVGVPIRLMDTRRPGGQTVDCYDQAGGRLAAGSTYQLQVTGRSWIPSSGVSSAVLNVTVVAPAAAGYLTVYPCGQTQPNASNLNFAAGDVIPNLAIAKVGTGGKVCIFTSVETNLLVDASGYFSGNDPKRALAAPGRLLDTRVGGQTVDGLHQSVGRIAANVPYELPVGSRAGLVANPTTVVLNVTAVNPSSGGHLTVYPCGQPIPNASNLNFVVGDVIPNLVVAKVGSGTKVCFVSSAATDLLVDVGGDLVGSTWIPLLAPARLLDTRNPGSATYDGAHQGVGRISAGGTYELPVAGRAGVLPTVDSVVLNVTAVNPGAGGYLTVYPCGEAQPNASNVNYSAGEVIPNSVLAKVPANGRVCIFSSADTDVLVDISGFFDF